MSATVNDPNLSHQLEQPDKTALAYMHPAEPASVHLRRAGLTAQACIISGRSQEREQLRLRHSLVDVAHKGERGPEADRAQQQEECVAHEAHVAKEEGRLEEVQARGRSTQRAAQQRGERLQGCR